MFDFFGISHRWARATIAQMVAGGLSAGGHAKLHRHLRDCQACRQLYDRRILVQRELEGSDFARCEVEHLDCMLFDAPSVAVAQKAGHRRWIGLGLASALAAGVVFMVAPPQHQDEYWGQRGSLAIGQLAIEAYCGSPIRPARDQGCSLDEVLTFAYSVRDELPEETSISIFGIDELGDVKYYAPTPHDAAISVASRSKWTPVGFGTQLRVNHIAGNLQIYALASPSELSAGDIDAIALQLKTTFTGDAPDQWHASLRSPIIQRYCGEQLESCASATLRLVIEESR